MFLETSPQPLKILTYITIQMKILRSIILFLGHFTESNFVFSLKFSADTTLNGFSVYFQTG